MRDGKSDEERLLAEIALEKERDFVAAILDTVGALVVVMDPRGRIVRFNRMCERTTGYDLDEVRGKAVWDLLLAPAEREPVRAVFEELRAGNFPNEHENDWITKQGEPRRIAWSNTALIDGSGAVEYVVGTGIDITEQRRGEEERRRLEQRIAQAHKLESLAVLAGGIAHDFNNLLVAILGNAELAMMGLAREAPPRQRLEKLRQAAIRASELTNQMLAYSGRGNFIVQRLWINEVVKEMPHLLDVAISKRSLIRYDLAQDLPPVEADAVQIRQVVMNLITNAAEAIGTEDGVISIRTELLDADADYLAESLPGGEVHSGRYVLLEVSDTGVGIDPETRSRIFDPFFSTKFAGRGLGLASVLGIVRGHGGAVRVESRPGRGTTMRILLPAAAEIEGQERPEPPPPVFGRTGRCRGVVLVVDDEAAVLSVVAESLRREGLEVLTAGGGAEALELLRSRGKEISAVLLDMTMPRMGGRETLVEMRKLGAGPPVILMSGYNEQEATSGLSSGDLAGFLKKPFRTAELTETVRRVIRDRPETGGQGAQGDDGGKG